MSLRFFIPGSLWLAAMWLLFLTPVDTPVHRVLGEIPARSIIQGVMYLGFSHLWLSGLKKQLKYESLRRKAMPIVFIAAILILVSSEITMAFCHIHHGILAWNLTFDILGTVLGMGTFKLLYNHCY